MYMYQNELTNHTFFVPIHMPHETAFGFHSDRHRYDNPLYTNLDRKNYTKKMHCRKLVKAARKQARKNR